MARIPLLLLPGSRDHYGGVARQLLMQTDIPGIFVSTDITAPPEPATSGTLSGITDGNAQQQHIPDALFPFLRQNPDNAHVMIFAPIAFLPFFQNRKHRYIRGGYGRRPGKSAPGSPQAPRLPPFQPK